MTTQRGAFIVFEGVDRVGKTTQAALLTERLSKVFGSVVQMRFPDYTLAGGAELKAYLASSVGSVGDYRTAHLLFCANRSAAIAKINTLLAAGTTIVCDRYVYSGITYSVAKGLPLEWCMQIETGLPEPDVVVYLTCDVSSIVTRKDFGDQLHDSQQFLERVKQAYIDLYQAIEHLECTHHTQWLAIQADESVEKVGECISTCVKEALATLVSNPPLGVMFVKK